jgi:hypothetical protein
VWCDDVRWFVRQKNNKIVLIFFQISWLFFMSTSHLISISIYINLKKKVGKTHNLLFICCARFLVSSTKLYEHKQWLCFQFKFRGQMICQNSNITNINNIRRKDEKPKGSEENSKLKIFNINLLFKRLNLFWLKIKL